MDDFAKYSKIERKIVQNNVKQDELRKTRSSTTVQTKVALSLMWRVLAVTSFFSEKVINP